MAVDVRELEQGLGRKPFELDTPRTESEIAALRRKVVTIA